MLVIAVSALMPSAGRAEAPDGSEIPPQNRADLKQVPPRPPAGTAEAQARVLFDAIVHDDPERAKAFFFPREAFLWVKAMAKPGRYYDRLYKRFERDIHALHSQLPDLDKAVFERLQLVRRGGWVKVREEGNRLPYWASRHSWLHYRVGQSVRKFELRVLITWGLDWYVIHLSEFK